MKFLAILFLGLLSTTSWAEEIVDVTKVMTHLQCRAFGRDSDPYYFETKVQPHNPGEPKGELSLLWSYNSLLNSRPIAYFKINSVTYETESKIYTVKFDDNKGTLSFQNGGGGYADFYNTRGNTVYETLSRCSILGNW